MSEFVFTGKLTLSGVTFYVSAPTLEEAKEAAKNGKYDEYDANGAEAVDCDINPQSGERN